MAQALTTPRAILWIGLAGFLVYAYPGYLGWDSMTQWSQARAGVYTDDHPPALAAMWRLLEHVMRGPLPMVLVAVGGFMIGMYMLLARVLSPRRAAVAVVLILWAPPVSSLFAVVFKDCEMAGFVALGLPLLVRMDRWRWVGLAAFVIATAMRYNALAATLPPVVLLFRATPTIRGWRRYVIAFVAWLGVTASAGLLNQVLADRSVHYWSASHAYQDIAGTLEYSRPYSDDEMRELLAGTPLVVQERIQGHMYAIYSPVDFRHLRAGDSRIWDPPTTDAHRAANAAAWKRVVFGNLGGYLRFRWDNFAMLMRFDGAVYVNAIVGFSMARSDLPPLDHDATWSRVQRVLKDKMVWISTTIVFDPYPYFFASLLLLILAIAWRDVVGFAVVASGLSYQLAWFFLAPTADYRYSHWMVCTTLTGAVWIIARRRGRSREPRPAAA